MHWSSTPTNIVCVWLDPKLFGPGFATAPTHSATESQIKYVLVTPEMLRGLAQGKPSCVSRTPFDD
jgi:hypothetical protein